MLARSQRKMTVALVALSIGVTLVSVVAAISRLAPASMAGTAVWIVSLLAAVPLAIAAFNAICDLFQWQAAPERPTEALLDTYWPVVERDFTSQFRLDSRRHTNTAARADAQLSNGAPPAPPATPIDPLHRPATQRTKQWWVGQ